MNVTKILGEQAGIQYQGVQDKSEADPRDHLVNALFTGIFKNGPFNKPFKVTEANIRKKLGFDPENLQYQAIEDCLKQGTPFVWVMRVDTELKWGPWQLGQDVSILNGIARYTGFKTDTKNAFDSSAEVDLTAAITASLSNSDMQQWQAVKDAANQLTGVTDWIFDLANNQIVYTDTSIVDPALYRYLIQYDADTAYYGKDLNDTCTKLFNKYTSERPLNPNDSQASYYRQEVKDSICYIHKMPINTQARYQYMVENPAYNPNAEAKQSRLPINTITQKIISNASSSDQGVSLLAETYIEEIAKGVTLENLIQQFEQNKIKR